MNYLTSFKNFKYHKDSILLYDKDTVDVVISIESKNWLSQIKYYCSLIGFYDVCGKSIKRLVDQGPIILRFYREKFFVLYYLDEYEYFYSYFEENISGSSHNYSKTLSYARPSILKVLERYHNENKTLSYARPSMLKVLERYENKTT